MNDNYCLKGKIVYIMNFRIIIMNKRIFISLFVVFTLLSFNIVSANDLNESQVLQINERCYQYNDFDSLQVLK